MIDIQFSCKAPSSFILPIAYGSHMMANHMFSTAKDVSKMQNRLICFTALPGGFVEYTEPAMFGGEYLYEYSGSFSKQFFVVSDVLI